MGVLITRNNQNNHYIKRVLCHSGEVFIADKANTQCQKVLNGDIIMTTPKKIFFSPDYKYSAELGLS